MIITSEKWDNAIYRGKNISENFKTPSISNGILLRTFIFFRITCQENVKNIAAYYDTFFDQITSYENMFLLICGF